MLVHIALSFVLQLVAHLGLSMTYLVAHMSFSPKSVGCMHLNEVFTHHSVVVSHMLKCDKLQFSATKWSSAVTETNIH